MLDHVEDLSHLPAAPAKPARYSKAPRHTCATAFRSAAMRCVVACLSTFATLPALAAISFVGVAANPADGGALAEVTSQVDITPVASMQAGDLVILDGVSRNSGSTLAIANSGGQSWTCAPQSLAAVPTKRLCYATFNGEWSSNPAMSHAAAGGNAISLYMTVYRPTSSAYVWTVDVPYAGGRTTPATSPFDVTIASQTTTVSSTVTYASWVTGLDTVGWTLQTGGWSQTTADYTNTTGSGLSFAFAYKIQRAAGATGAVVNRMSSGSSTVTSAITFKEAVPKYDVFEVELTSTRSPAYSNPFTGVALTAVFTDPSGVARPTATGFHDGGATWRVRFACDQLGRWQYTTSAAISEGGSDGGLQGQTGSFTCAAPVADNHGFIKTEAITGTSTPGHYYFKFSDGTPFYGIGDTAYGLTNSITDVQLKAYLDKRKAKGFNFIRFFASGYPARASSPAPRYVNHIDASVGLPWQTTTMSATPNVSDFRLDRLNVAYFKRLDTIIAELKKRQMYAEIEVFNYYSRPFVQESTWAGVEALWARYVVSRLSAYTTVFMWTVANEYELYPSGVYPSGCAVPMHTAHDADDIWANDMGNLFRSADAHGHPTTSHNVTFDANRGVHERWIAPSGTPDGISVITQQRWGPDGPAPSKCPNIPRNPNDIEETIAIDRVDDKPVVNTENGYEYDPDYYTLDNGGVTTEQARKAAWRVFVGGGASYAAGFAVTWDGSHVLAAANAQPGRPFENPDHGLADYIAIHAAFVPTINYREMTPVPVPTNIVSGTDILCLMKPGEDYVIYAPVGGTFTLNLSGSLASQTFAVEWFNPRTGARTPATSVAGGGIRTFTSQDANDWVLHVQRAQ